MIDTLEEKEKKHNENKSNRYCNRNIPWSYHRCIRGHFVILLNTDDHIRLEKTDYISLTDVFPEDGEIGPGESKSINPVITSGATVDMYTFIRVVMPLTPDGTAGLYNMNVRDGWSEVESGVVGDRWVDVYGWKGALTPGESTTAFSDRITMVNMSMEEYEELQDINVLVTAYACGVEYTEIDDAWSAIKEHYEL